MRQLFWKQWYQRRVRDQLKQHPFMMQSHVTVVGGTRLVDVIPLSYQELRGFPTVRHISNWLEKQPVSIPSTKQTVILCGPKPILLLPDNNLSTYSDQICSHGLLVYDDSRAVIPQPPFEAPPTPPTLPPSKSTALYSADIFSIEKEFTKKESQLEKCFEDTIEAFQGGASLHDFLERLLSVVAVPQLCLPQKLRDVETTKFACLSEWVKNQAQYQREIAEIAPVIENLKKIELPPHVLVGDRATLQDLINSWLPSEYLSHFPEPSATEMRKYEEDIKQSTEFACKSPPTQRPTTKTTAASWDTTTADDAHTCFASSRKSRDNFHLALSNAKTRMSPLNHKPFFQQADSDLQHMMSLRTTIHSATLEIYNQLKTLWGTFSTACRHLQSLRLFEEFLLKFTQNQREVLETLAQCKPKLKALADLSLSLLSYSTEVNKATQKVAIEYISILVQNQMELKRLASDGVGDLQFPQIPSLEQVMTTLTTPTPGTPAACSKCKALETQVSDLKSQLRSVRSQLLASKVSPQVVDRVFAGW
eukprot:TRINITY_DN9593_c0_g1_i1.p1 TRINITY_DN9593_c0_g1~~TRINITY_DN9593_c0_g1_i1.p1  ORF type:complete len:534 (+),score=134.98 TRINITY_DN9593_c0_g1_i1:813-2414(+)